MVLCVSVMTVRVKMDDIINAVINTWNDHLKSCIKKLNLCSQTMIT